MDKRNRNLVAIGALTLVGVVVFFLGMRFLLGNPVFSGGLDLVLALDDGGGLKRGDRVHLQGVDIGSVQQVRLDEDRGVIADIRVSDAVTLPADTRAAVTGDVFGAHMVDLRPGDALVRLEEGDTIEGLADPAPLELATGLGVQARAVLSSADSLLSPETIRDVRATTAVLPASARELRAAFTELRLASAALRRTAEGVEEAHTADQVNLAVQQVESSAQALTAAANAMERSIGSFESVLAKIDHGQGTLGRLVNDSSLYIVFNQTLREMGALATDIRARPSRYINLKIF